MECRQRLHERLNVSSGPDSLVVANVPCAQAYRCSGQDHPRPWGNVSYQARVDVYCVSHRSPPGRHESLAARPGKMGGDAVVRGH